MAERLARQLLLLGIALALWALWSKAALYALLLCYVAACLAFSWLDGARVLRALSPRAVAALALLGLVPGGAALLRAWPALVEHEGLPIALASFADRLRLEQLPAIAPALVSADQPQTFFVYARGASAVRVRLARGIEERAAEALGEGVFRLDYDPRRDGTPKPAEGEVEAVLRVDGTAHTRAMHTVTPLPHPRWPCVAPGGALAALPSLETDELIVVSARGLARRIAVGDGPSACAFVSETRVAVSHEHEAALWMVDALTGDAAAKIELGTRQRALAVSPDGTRLAVARAGTTPELVLVATAQPSARISQLALPAAPDWLAYGIDAHSLLVATRGDAKLHRVRVSDTGLAFDGALPLGRPAVALGRIGDGARVLVATTDFRPDGSPQSGNHFVQDQLLELDVASLRVERVLLTARRTARQTRAGDVDSGLSPIGIAPLRAGGALVAFAGSDELWALDALDAQPERLELAPSGVLAPHGVAELADGTRIVSSPSQGLIALLAPGERAPRLVRLAPDDASLGKRTPDALARRLGERGFYEATRSGIACQSCHLHADSDEAAYNLGDRTLLPTLSVRGLFGTAPYLRDGTYGHLRDLDWVAQTLYRGYLRRAPGRAEVLEAYLAALPRTPSARPATQRDHAAERRGLRAFFAAGCPSCHAPPAFTTLGQHRPAALFPEHAAHGPYELLDTPSLLSVGASAPYLSDGRARTLDEVLVDHNRENRHGDVASLSADERRDLVRFLEAL